MGIASIVRVLSAYEALLEGSHAETSLLLTLRLLQVQICMAGGIVDACMPSSIYLQIALKLSFHL